MKRRNRLRRNVQSDYLSYLQHGAVEILAMENKYPHQFHVDPEPFEMESGNYKLLVIHAIEGILVLVRGDVEPTKEEADEIKRSMLFTSMSGGVPMVCWRNLIHNTEAYFEESFRAG